MGGETLKTSSTVNTHTGISWRRKAVTKVGSLIVDRLRWHAANGESISLFNRHWWQTSQPNMSTTAKAKGMFIPNTDLWDKSEVYHAYPPDIAVQIIQTPLSTTLFLLCGQMI